MIINRIEGTTRVMGAHQKAYLGLPIRDIILEGNPPRPAMMSSWSPTRDELAQLQAGAPILLTILGEVHPPVLLSVGKVPK